MSADHTPAPNQVVVGGSMQPTVTTAPALTARQKEVLEAYAQTGNRQEAADRVGISVDTMRRHLMVIYAKLGVGNSTEAFKAMGWLRVPRKPRR